MSDLTHEQKHLLFDYCFNLTNKTDTAQAKRLMDSHTEAENLCAKINSALAPLKALDPEDCPDPLVQKTVSICNHNHIDQEAVE